MPAMRNPLPLAALALVLAACGSVQVHPTATTAPPRPKDCDLAFVFKAPDRAYDELAELETHVTAPPREGALELLRPKACQLGADALIVTKNQVLNELGHTLVAGTAIKFRPLEPAPAATPPPAPSEPAAPAPPAPPAAADAPGAPSDPQR
jgi:hypothetical protein